MHKCRYWYCVCKFKSHLQHMTQIEKPHEKIHRAHFFLSNSRIPYKNGSLARSWKTVKKNLKLVVSDQHFLPCVDSVLQNSFSTALCQFRNFQSLLIREASSISSTLTSNFRSKGPKFEKRSLSLPYSNPVNKKT